MVRKSVVTTAPTWRIAERLAAADPGNAQHQRDLSISHNRLGDLAVAAGDSTTADQHYRAALTIAERLAAAHPDNAPHQRDLSAVEARLDSLRAPKSSS